MLNQSVAFVLQGVQALDLKIEPLTLLNQAAVLVRVVDSRRTQRSDQLLVVGAGLIHSRTPTTLLQRRTLSLDGGAQKLRGGPQLARRPRDPRDQRVNDLCNLSRVYRISNE